MADLVDVEDALVAFLGAVVYPRGAAFASVTGAPVRIYRGWPMSKSLDADVKGTNPDGTPRAPVSSLTVYSRPNTAENITRYPRAGWVVSATGTPTLAASLAAGADGAQVLALTGTPDPAQLVSVLCAGVPYGYTTQAGDTLSSVAQVLAGALPGAVQDGATVTFQGGGDLARCAVVALAVGVVRIGQTRVQLTVTLWCPTREARDALARAVGRALADAPFIAVPQDVPARIKVLTTVETDVSEASSVFRREIVLSSEYETTTSPAGLARALWIGVPLSPVGGFPAEAAAPAPVKTVAVTITDEG